MKTLLAVRHLAYEDLGSLARPLAEAGYGIRYVDAPTADFLLLAREPWDLVVVLGGPIGVNDGADYPFVTDELKFVEACLKQELPILGICLGSQFIAKALGSAVRRAAAVEFGWKPLELTDEGRRSPLKHFDAPVFHWHGDQFDLPAGARPLARTDLTPCQGFDWGRSTLAIQFHPEVTARGLEHWWVGSQGEIREQDLKPAALRHAAERHAPPLERQATAMLVEWLAALPAA